MSPRPVRPPRPRPAIAALPAYVPGRPPVLRPGQVGYKLSSNENPHPPLPEVVAAAEAALAELNRYPDLGCTTLYAALGERLAVAPEQLVAGTGSVAVLYHLLQAFCGPGDEVVHAWRSFEAYPIAVTVAGATSVRVPLTADARHDLGAMAAAVTDRTRVVVLCTPNNPTGPALTQREVADFVARVPEDVLVVVDEAYRDFVRSDDPTDAVALLDEHANVVALRTFAKASGLAGLRVGYAVAHPEVVAPVRACALPFGVSAAAQAAALAALAHADAIEEQVRWIADERDRMAAGLRDQGWAVPDAQGNFVWLPLPGPDEAAGFAADAGAAGIAVRPFAGAGVRVSVGPEEGNDLLLQVAAEVVVRRRVPAS